MSNNLKKQAQVLCALNSVPLDRIRLMKTLFLFWFRSGKPEEGPFIFKPYLYGPCSFELYESLEYMSKNHLIVEPLSTRSTSLYITEKGKIEFNKSQELKDAEKDALSRIAIWCSEQNFTSLLRSVYEEAPEFASKSIVREKVL